jgi:hypothetical protein
MTKKVLLIAKVFCPVYGYIVCMYICFRNRGNWSFTCYDSTQLLYLRGLHCGIEEHIDFVMCPVFGIDKE